MLQLLENVNADRQLFTFKSLTKQPSTVTKRIKLPFHDPFVFVEL